jgi:hypothetical protein
MRSHLPCKKDANHGELTKAFEDLGCSVLDLSMVGSDCLDVLVGCAGVDVLVEFKTDDGDLTTGQVRFIRDWSGRVPEVARTVDDCIAIVKKIRAQLRGSR